MLTVGDDQHRLEAPQEAIRPPVARQLDGGTFEVASVLFELRLESRKQGERIGRGAGKPSEDLVTIESSNLASAVFQDRVAERDLSVSAEHRPALVPHGEDGRGVNHSTSISTEEGRQGSDAIRGGQRNEDTPQAIS